MKFEEEDEELEVEEGGGGYLNIVCLRKHQLEIEELILF